MSPVFTNQWCVRPETYEEPVRYVNVSRDRDVELRIDLEVDLPGPAGFFTSLPSPRAEAVLVNTGSKYTIFTAETAAKLGVVSDVARGDLWCIPSYDGRMIWVSMVRIPVKLGKDPRKIRVAFPLDPTRWRIRSDYPPSGNVLGMTDVLPNYMLCFTDEALYSFPKLP